MELTNDLLAVQGILSSVMKNTGEFTRINYRGGNEDKILCCMMELRKFLASKNYLKNEQINNAFDKELEDIVIFLAVNTVYKHPLKLEEYSHLINTLPPLSKCLFANIVYGLDLCKYYCCAIEKLPIDHSIELLEEAVQCLQKSTPKFHLDYAAMFLKAAANKLACTDFTGKVEDDIDNLSEITNIMLHNLTGLYSDQTKGMKAIQIYQHMGYCLLHLFDLLLYCDKDCPTLKKFIGNVIRACCCIFKNVTIDVFCAWAEINVEDQPLQTIISGKAYLIVERYQKYNEARELLSMLGSIARKPKTLTELIQDADVTTMINKISQNDRDQNSWFRALMGTQVLKNKEAMKCVSTFAYLCNEDDVTLLMNLSIQNNDTDAKKLVVKCAASLSLEKLIVVSTKHFYRNKFSNILTDEVEDSLMLLFNKLNENVKLQEELASEIILLLLQNPRKVLNYIYGECLKNKFYAACLKDTFLRLNEIVKIDNIAIVILNEVIGNDMPNSENLENYIELFKTFMETSHISKDLLLLKILFPLLKRLYEQKSFSELRHTLQIIRGTNMMVPVKEETKEFIELLLEIMTECRCKFLIFSMLKQEIVEDVVDIFSDFCEVNFNSKVQVSTKKEDCFTDYYKKYISSDWESSFFRNLCPGFDINSYGSCVTRMLKVLPSSITKEWLVIAEEIIKDSDSNKCMELLTDVMILLSQLVITQENNESLISALKYCIKNFRIAVQEKIQQNSSIDGEVNVTRQVCRLLARLPDSLKEDEGFALVGVLTDRSLKALAGDKEFLCHLIQFKNRQICKVLAQKISS